MLRSVKRHLHSREYGRAVQGVGLKNLIKNSLQDLIKSCSSFLMGIALVRSNRTALKIFLVFGVVFFCGEGLVQMDWRCWGGASHVCGLSVQRGMEA